MRTPLPGAPLAWLLLALSPALAACAAKGTSSVGTGGQGGAPATTTGTGGIGGMSTTAATTASAGGGGGVFVCKGNIDCASKPATPICDLASGDCVVCLPDNDTCPMGQHCTLAFQCEVGCKNAADCAAPTLCDLAKHQCVGCLLDVDCPLGSVCQGEACVPGCSPTQGCEAGKDCCGTSCVDLKKSLIHCGDCATICPMPDHASAFCKMAACGFTCDAAWADCNGDPMDGCEQNILQDGPCLCAPGSTQACYAGGPGTKDVGVCHAGVQTCDPSGIAWGPCVGQVIPTPEKCNGLDDDCNGAPEAPGCVPCVGGTGSCNGNVGQYCPDNLSIITEVCDPLQGTTCNPQTGRCDGACSLVALGSSYLGCDYFPTVTANLVDTLFHFAAAVSNTSALPATVTVTQGAATLQTLVVAPNSVQVFLLPWVNALKGPAGASVIPFPASIKVPQGAFRLRSTQPVSVYQFNPLEYQLGATFSYSNDASILLPTSVWTGTYRVAARHHFGGGSGFFAVTARDDNTKVQITAPPGGVQVKAGIPGIAVTGNGSVVLNSGDVIEVVTNGSNAINDPNDVTGTLVSADKPVQVIGGHQCTYVPDDVGFCDHLEESMFPFETLSTSYLITAPLIPSGGQVPKVEFVRFIATKPATTLTYDPPQPGAPAFLAQAGAWAEIANTTADFQVTASEPILVAQYMEGQNAGGNAGDPSLSLAVAKAQYRKSYLFHAPVNYSSNYVNVTAPTGAMVLLDGVQVGGFSPIGGTGFSVARALLGNAGSGNHSMSSSQAFGISVYGYGQFTSYWYPGGSELTKLHN